MMENVNFEVFTREEKERIMKARRTGNTEVMTSVIDTMTPAKEIEIQKIIDAMTPLTDGFESEVRKEMEKKLPNGPQSPQEEAEWENKLQAEYREFLAKKEEKQAKRIESLSKKKAKKEDKEESKKSKK